MDFENDCVRTSLTVARALRERLWGVRLDTAADLVDQSLQGEMGDFDPRGVNPRLVEKVRDALDREGFTHVKIVVSGGFDADKIRRFKEAGVPVDSYGVGSAWFEAVTTSRGRRNGRGKPFGEDGSLASPQPADGHRLMTSTAGTVMRIGWVVDVQRDFMEPDGRLYVHDLGDTSDPGATSIVATLGEAVVWMRENCTVIVYTGIGTPSTTPRSILTPQIRRRAPIRLTAWAGPTIRTNEPGRSS